MSGPQTYTDEEGRTWTLLLLLRPRGTAGSAGTRPEDLDVMFESESGERRVVRAYGLGAKPLDLLDEQELADLFARAEPVPGTPNGDA